MQYKDCLVLTTQRRPPITIAPDQIEMVEAKVIKTFAAGMLALAAGLQERLSCPCTCNVCYFRTCARGRCVCTILCIILLLEEGKNKHKTCSNMQAMQMVIKLRRRQTSRRSRDKGKLHDLQGHKNMTSIVCSYARLISFTFHSTSDWITFARPKPRRRRVPSQRRLGRLSLPFGVFSANAKGRRGKDIRRKNSACSDESEDAVRSNAMILAKMRATSYLK